MQTQIINGKKIRDEILEKVKASVLELPFSPVFCDVIVGDDPVSLQYVRMKAKTAESVGIKFREACFPLSITTEELIFEIESLNRVPHMCGIIVQLPLPPHIDKEVVLDSISPELDVDCLGSQASKMFYNDQNNIGFPAALACVEILDSTASDLIDKHIAILGQGMLVGRPVAHLLRKRGLDVTTIDINTNDKFKILKNADVIISGIGQGKFLAGGMIKMGAIVIDAGTSEDNGAIVGDVDLDTILPVASFVSPTPGGVGPVTVAMLLQNVVAVATEKLGKL